MYLAWFMRKMFSSNHHEIDVPLGRYQSKHYKRPTESNNQIFFASLHRFKADGRTVLNKMHALLLKLSKFGGGWWQNHGALNLVIYQRWNFSMWCILNFLIRWNRILFLPSAIFSFPCMAKLFKNVEGLLMYQGMSGSGQQYNQQVACRHCMAYKKIAIVQRYGTQIHQKLN